MCYGRREKRERNLCWMTQEDFLVQVSKTGSWNKIIGKRSGGIHTQIWDGNFWPQRVRGLKQRLCARVLLGFPKLISTQSFLVILKEYRFLGSSQTSWARIPGGQAQTSMFHKAAWVGVLQPGKLPLEMPGANGHLCTSGRQPQCHIQHTAIWGMSPCTFQW